MLLIFGFYVNCRTHLSKASKTEYLRIMYSKIIHTQNTTNENVSKTNLIHWGLYLIARGKRSWGPLRALLYGYNNNFKQYAYCYQLGRAEKCESVNKVKSMKTLFLFLKLCWSFSEEVEKSGRRFWRYIAMCDDVFDHSPPSPIKHYIIVYSIGIIIIIY